MTNIILEYDRLSDEHPGVTDGTSLFYAEAIRVCLGRHHTPSSIFRINDNGDESQATVNWTLPTRQEQAAHANDIDATEVAAYGLALGSVNLTRGLVAVRRAETRTGADYYLASPEDVTDDLEGKLRLEVSGTDGGNEAAILRRLETKINQARDGDSNLPALACVVGFAELRIVSRDVEE